MEATQIASAPAALTAIPNYSNSTTKKLVKRGRFRNAQEIRSAFMLWWNADLIATRNRAAAQASVDGELPYDPMEESRLGLSGRCNFNTGVAGQSQEQAEAPYTDILEGIDKLAYIPTGYGDEASRLVNEPIISDELTKMIRGWYRFYPLWAYNSHIFTMFGLSFAYFPDDENWQWEIQSQQHFKLPRRVRADLEGIGDLCCKDKMSPHDLFRYCQDKDAAKEAGWDTAECLDAIKEAAGQQGMPSNDLEEWEKAWKDNDCLFGATDITIEVIHYWARELDGTVSHYIVRYDGQGEFLYKGEGKYTAMSRFIVPYMYGVGSNGDFASIRGHSQKVFGLSQAQNRLFCKIMDMAIHAATPHLQAKDEEALEALPLTPMGPYMVMTAGVEYQETQSPDFTKNLSPAFTLVDGLLASRTAQYGGTSGNGEVDRTERTKYEKQMQHAEGGKLTTSGMNLFMLSWGVHLKEVVRRIIRKGYDASEPGGSHVQSFYAACEKRGVPKEAIEQIDVSRIEVNTGIGKGSAMERQVMIDGLETLYYRADARGQNIINRQSAASKVGYRLANEIFPDQPGIRPPQDAENANLENDSICTCGLIGTPSSVKVLPNQNHDIHLQGHLAQLSVLNDGLTQLTLPLEKAIPQMQPLHDHAEDHFKALDPKNPSRGKYKQDLQILDEVIVNGSKHLLKLQEEAQKQQQAGVQQQGAPGAMPPPQGPNDPINEQGMTPALLVHAAKAQQDLQGMELKQQTAIKLEQEKSAAKIDLLDKETAAKIQLENAKALAQG